MKRTNLIIVICLILAGCGSSKRVTNQQKSQVINWNEWKPRSVAKIRFGIPSAGQTSINYKRNGATAFTIKLSEPKVVVAADKPEGWGYYQFPTLTRLENGFLQAKWSMHADDIRSYGTSAWGSAISINNGKTWDFDSVDSTQLSGYKLSNGDRILVVDPKPVKVTDLKMPEPIGKTNFKYRKTNFKFYKLKDMPSGVNGVFINRLSPGQNKWKIEEAKLNDPNAVRYSSKDLVPVVWWGDIHTVKDGSLVAGIYPGYYIKDDGQVDKQMGVVFYRSINNGHSWNIQGRIPFTPDLSIDSMATDRIGFTEPAYEVMADGSLLCVIRSADGDGVTNGVGNGSMYASRSVDIGKTWTKPEVIAPNGVLPRLLRLENGVVVISTGRPGVQLLFSKGGVDSKSWTDPIEMLPYDSESHEVQYAVSCGYTGMIATGPNRFLLIYSDFKYKNAANQERKAIKIREVTINPI